MQGMSENNQTLGAIIFKQRGKHRYYYYSRSHRVKLDPGASGKTRGSGKSRVVSEQVYLGTAEDVLQKLRSQQKAGEPNEVRNKQFGLPVALFEMAERIGLREVINSEVAGKIKGISIGDFALIAAINRVGNHTPKESMGRWYQKTDLGRLQKVGAGKLNSKNFWYAFDKIVSERQIKEEKVTRGLAPNEKIDIDELDEILNDSKIEAIEKGLWENLARRFGFVLDAILYDTTNFYSYHQNGTPNSLAQFGKNKQNQNDKRQVGLQLAILRDLGIPVFHQVYPGNQNDARLFPTAVRTLVRRCFEVSKKTERLVLVFDKGNNSAENIALLENQSLPVDFVGALSPSHHRNLVAIPLDRFDGKVGKFSVLRTRKVVFGAMRTIVITYHEGTAGRQEKSFEAQMGRAMKEAKAYFATIAKEPTKEVKVRMETFLKTQKIGSSQALRFYDLKVTHNGWVNRLSLRRKRSEVSLKKASFGKKILFTNLHSAATETIVDYYKSSWQIEDSFHQIKDRDLVAYAPAYHWTDSKIRVHAFICVLALLLLKLLNHIARENDIEMSTKLLVEELEDITMVILVYSDRKASRKVSAMSTVQKRLFDLLELQKYT